MSHKKSRKHDFGRGAGGGANLGLIVTPMLDMAFQLLAFFIMTYHPPAFIGFIDTERGQLPVDEREKDKDKGKDKEKQDKTKKIDQKEDKGVGDKMPEKAQEKKPEKDFAPEPDTPPDLTKTDLDFLRVEVLTAKSDKDHADYLEPGDPISVQILRPEYLGTPKILKTQPTVPNAPLTTKKEKAQAREAFVDALRKELDGELKAIRKTYELLEKPLPVLTLAVDGEIKHRYWMAFYDTSRQAGYNKVSFALRKPERKARE